MNWTKICKGLLLFSSIILFVIALSFGGNPELWVPSHYDTPPVSDINSTAIYRSVMGLILGCCAFWTYAAVKNKFVQAALYSLMFAMFGLALSRIYSLLIDGKPTSILIIYMIMELATGLTVYYLIGKNHSSESEN